MVDGLHVAPGERVAQALLTVPRHLFVPEVDLVQAYEGNRSVVTKRDGSGAALSSVSAVYVQAAMLELANLRPGMRVLEIGSGGYNAALVSEVVGSSGRVVTVDIDADVVARAERLLDTAGYGAVRVVHGDAEHGVPGDAPFDRIIVTVGSWDIPPAWWDQLVDGGRIVAPLLLRGTTRTVALDKRDGRWIEHAHERSGFVAMQGLGAHEEAFLSLAEGEQVGLRVDGVLDVEAAPLAQALRSPRTMAWSGVEFAGDEPFDDMDLFLVTQPGPTGLLWALPGAVDSQMVSNWARWGAPTRFSPTGFAYRVSRRVPDTDRYEIGARAHGPDGAALADQLVEFVRVWDRRHRLAGSRGRITVVPADTPDPDLPAGCVMDRRHTRVIVSWPTGSNTPTVPAAIRG